MVDIVVGCPVYRREWVLPQWFEGIERACARVDAVPRYAFVGPEGDPSLEPIKRHAEVWGRTVDYVATPEEAELPYERSWLEPRLRQMVDLRNQLLRRVRAMEPDFFFSVDSDVILHSEGLSSLLQTQTEQGCEAVGGKCYLSTGPRDFACPSYFDMSRSYGPRRRDHWAVCKVDVIMAIKLMTPAAYSVDYEFSIQGEDTGWSQVCTARGMTLFWDARVCSLHVMDPKYLGKEDPRVLQQPKGWP